MSEKSTLDKTNKKAPYIGYKITVTRFGAKEEEINIADIIKKGRVKTGHTIESAAKALNMGIDEYEKYEKGELQPDYTNIGLFIKQFRLSQSLKNVVYNPNTPYYALKLRQLRIKHGYRLKDVAEKMQISLHTYAGYESGRNEPDIKTLIKIAELYDTFVDKIIRE
ncbi:MAG: helix-turn-helix transcriptional regulator [Peptococcaceae bacterium]|jgi:transcriptional regulator with XRE-family HTH domain|nr:helix-turn-helix transcriptional regulator [Peptococcaceae bacterium]